MKEIEQLYCQYKQDVYHYLLSLTRDPDLAEDLLSETFVNVISSLHTFQGKSSIKTWLFAIARNLWLTSLRKKRPNLEFDELLVHYVSENILDIVVTRDTIQRIARLLSEKDRRTQTIMKMRINGYSFSEIAEEVDMRENSTRVIYFRTKKWLKEILEKEGFR